MAGRMLVKYTGAAKFLCDHVEDASPNSQVCVAETRSSSTRLTSRLASTPRSSRTAGTHPVQHRAGRRPPHRHERCSRRARRLPLGADSVLGGRARGGHHQRSLRNCRRETRLRAGMGIAPLSRPLIGLLRVEIAERRYETALPDSPRGRPRVRDGRPLGRLGG